MRVRDHIVLSTTGAVALSPFARRAVLAPWLASILIDADHYLWFCWRERRLSPLAAVRAFNEADAPEHGATRALHNPAVLLLIGLLGARRRRWLLSVAAGMLAHVALDAHHRSRLRAARSRALIRDRFTCRACGSTSNSVTAHVWRQPAVLPSYRVTNLVTLCPACHRAVHADRTRSDRIAEATADRAPVRAASG